MIKENGYDLFCNFSENIFKNKILGILVFVIIDTTYINSWRKNFTLLSMVIQTFIIFLITNIILQNIFRMKITE